MSEPVAIRTVAELLAQLPSAPAGGRLLIGVAGSPGAGKSTVAELLAAAIGPTAVQVPMDGYHLSDAVLTAHGALDRKGAPDTFDGWGYAALLRRIREDPNQPIYAPSFARDLEQPIAGAIEIEPHHRVVVSEGNYLLLDEPAWAEVRNRFDVVWYLTIDPVVRHRRLVDRHVEFGKDRAYAEAWVDRVDEPNARQVEASAVRADLVLDVTELELPA